jgi:hypothetical protein
VRQGLVTGDPVVTDATDNAQQNANPYRLSGMYLSRMRGDYSYSGLNSCIPLSG